MYSLAKPLEFWKETINEFGNDKLEKILNAYSYHIVGSEIKFLPDTGDFKNDYLGFYEELVREGLLELDCYEKIALSCERLDNESFLRLFPLNDIFIDDLFWLSPLQGEYFFDGFDYNLISSSIFTNERKGIIFPNKYEIERYNRHRLTRISLHEIHKEKYIHGFIDMKDIIDIEYPQYYWIKGNRIDRNLRLYLAGKNVRQENLPLKIISQRFPLSFLKEFTSSKKLYFVINTNFQISLE
ncbi:hypothetical protein J4221_00685 [Candidatus Pacearchaeota archaeon]|nr:hypothetical protein [Candidatus Pacearchaeota archaeon]